MKYYSQLQLAVKDLSVWQCTVLSAMCAESVRPVIMRLARKNVQDLVSQVIELCWTGNFVDSGTTPEKLQRKIKRLPEANPDDLNFPMYEIMHTLSIVSYALDSIRLVNKSELYTVYAASRATDIYDIVDTDDLESELLSEIQIKSQFSLIEYIIHSTDQQSNIINYAQSSANTLKKLLEKNLEKYLIVKGWSGC